MMSNHVIIIAEAGVNHNGNYDLAVKMVHEAKMAGADYVKFQTAVPELVISSIAPKAEYQKETTGSEQSQLEMCRAIHLPLSAYAPLKKVCDEEGIGFMSTPFDLVSIDTLEPLGMDYYKIPSGEITNLPYLRKIASKGRPVIMSTGMCELDEIGAAIDVLTVRAMNELAAHFGVKVGYSDHTVGIEVPIAAVALGATVIEKHFTLDRNLPGPDHKASLEPAELVRMVESIRNIEQALGDGHKHVSESERPNMVVARKSIVAATDIKKGDLLTEQNITVKRPGNGISPMLWDSVVGTRAIADFPRDTLIRLS